MMRVFQTLAPATIAMALVGLPTPGVAQMYPGGDVTVNPAALPSPTFAPGQPVIHLHRPHRVHRHVVNATAPADTADQTTPSPDAGTPPAAPADSSTTDVTAPAKSRHHGRNDQAASTDAGTANPIPFSFGEDIPSPAAPPAKVATKEQPRVPGSAPAASSGGVAQPVTLAKRGAIIFEHSATDPQPSQMDGIKLLAGDLNSALQAGATSIQLQAYGGAPGDKSSDARRISLRRAIAIRQILIDNGVPADHIAVRAMGGATDKGAPDRVDVYVLAS
jgi:outer membrane protein OmpA-like peptidoglycan-associated protein